MTKAKRPVGRPKAPTTEVMRIRLPIDTHAAVMQMGGDKFVKRVLIEAIDKTKGAK